MPDEEHGDEATLQEDEGTAFAGNTPDDLIEELAATGVSDDTLEKVRKGVLMHRDYTRKTQELAAQRRQVEQVMPLVQQVLQQQQNQHPTEGAVKRLVSKLKEANPDAAEVFEQFGDAMQEELDQMVQARLQPVANAQRQTQINQALEQLFEDEVVHKLGDSTELRKFWPQLKKRCLELLPQMGAAATPYNVLVSEFEDVFDKLYEAKRERRNKQRNAGSLEGMRKARRSSAMPAGQNGGSGKKLNSQEIVDAWYERMRARKRSR